MSIVGFTALLALLTVCSGYFSSTETALFSLSKMKIQAYRTAPDPRKQLIAELLLQPRDLLVTVFMMNTLVNILLQNVASSMFGTEAGWDLKIGVPLVLTLVFGEIIPKNIGLQINETLSYYSIPSINFFQNILSPVRRFIVTVTAPISRLLFFYLKPEASISQEELEHVLKTSKEHGILEEEEAEFVRGYLKLQDKQVKELMCPKEDMLFYDIQEPITKLIYLFVDQECTRLPICDGDIDSVLGVMSAKQFFLNRNTIQNPKDLRNFLSKPFYIPETAQAKTLLYRFDQRNTVFAIVVNEYGSVVGVITREDIVEVVIGEIKDLRDQKALYTRSGNDVIIASGKLELDDFNELFQSNLTSLTGMVSIGGWLTEKIGSIPKAGTTFETDEFLFQVLSAEANRVTRLYIRNRKPEKAS